MSTLGVISNPTSGSGRGAKLAAHTIALLATRGHKVRDLSRGSWSASLDWAREGHRDLDALVVVGGDGTVHLGLQACVPAGLPLGIVAAGSGNDIAASLGLPIHDIPASVAAIESGLDGSTAMMDVGRIDGPGVAERRGRRYFAAVLSVGLDAAVADYASRITWPRGPIKYKVATARILPRFKPYGVHIEVDGQHIDQRCTLVAIANSPMFGGGLTISPESSMTDGEFELLLAEAMSPWAIAKIFPKLYKGTHLDDPRVRVVRAKRVRIGSSDVGALLPPASADGELIGPVPLDVRVMPHALQVLGGKPDTLRV